MQGIPSPGLPPPEKDSQIVFKASFSHYGVTIYNNLSSLRHFYEEYLKQKQLFFSFTCQRGEFSSCHDKRTSWDETELKQ